MDYKIKAITDAIRRLADAIDDEFNSDEIKWYPCVERGGVVNKPSHIPPTTMALKIDELGDKYLFGAEDVMFINYYYDMPFVITDLIFKYKGKITIERLTRTPRGVIESKMERLLGYVPIFNEYGKFINPPAWRETSSNWRQS
nr:MAG TPA: hypothetical protein [Caudoviricetes sp.]